MLRTLQSKFVLLVVVFLGVFCGGVLLMRRAMVRLDEEAARLSRLTRVRERILHLEPFLSYFEFLTNRPLSGSVLAAALERAGELENRVRGVNVGEITGPTFLEHQRRLLVALSVFSNDLEQAMLCAQAHEDALRQVQEDMRRGGARVCGSPQDTGRASVLAGLVAEAARLGAHSDACLDDLGSAAPLATPLGDTEAAEIVERQARLLDREKTVSEKLDTQRRQIEERIRAFQRLLHNFIFVSEEAVNASVQDSTALRGQIVRMSAWLGILAFLLVNLVVALGGHLYVLRPVVELSRLIQSVRDGDWDVRFRVRRRDELSRLGTAFNGMLEKIQHNRARQAVAQALLEQQVRERTTELEQRNREMEESQRKAEAGSRTKSAFIATVSHELRTPLNAIIGFTDLLRDTPLTDEQKEYVAIMARSGETLLRLINQILDFAKIEAGKIQYHFDAVDAREAVQAVADALRLNCQPGVELAAFVAAAVPQVFTTDRHRLSQILTNLVGNACRFTRAGSIRIEVTPHESEDGTELLLFQVRDTGIGIPKDKHTAIFEAFTQADNTTTREYGGTGLGLAITRELVHGLGGRIWVESEVGQGSTFSFVLPRQPKQAAPSPVPSATSGTPAPGQPQSDKTPTASLPAVVC